MELVIDGIIIEDAEILSKVDELLQKDKAFYDNDVDTYDKAYDLALAYEDLESLLLEKLGIEKDFIELVKIINIALGK